MFFITIQKILLQQVFIFLSILFFWNFTLEKGIFGNGWQPLSGGSICLQKQDIIFLPYPFSSTKRKYWFHLKKWLDLLTFSMSQVISIHSSRDRNAPVSCFLWVVFLPLCILWKCNIVCFPKKRNLKIIP